MFFYLTLLESEEEKDRFSRLYRAQRQRMYSAALYLLHEPADAEDAVQDAFLAMIKILDTITEPESMRTAGLCVLVARRKALDILRKRKNLILTEPDELEQEAGPEILLEDPSPLEEALLKISPRYREMLLLRYADELTPGEIAKLLGMKTPAVRRVLSRARQALKEQLEDKA